MSRDYFLDLSFSPAMLWGHNFLPILSGPFSDDRAFMQGAFGVPSYMLLFSD